MNMSVWKVKTQDPENFDEEVKSLVTAWWLMKNKMEEDDDKINSREQPMMRFPNENKEFLMNAWD